MDKNTPHHPANAKLECAITKRKIPKITRAKKAITSFAMLESR